ncbi:MAG: SUMF1/EgtB/PvdO family nonheme iron enzyme [Lewinellaceae bacterium]|nr:SUMF1/EgtB/PvdO family nonheme iron enzyme [Lewinellaceae bacterium]
MKRYPFKFLDAYTREDQDIFFGREEEVERLYEMAFQADLLLVYGASGTGKTSLIQCGLASKFQSYDWLALNVRRGRNLNESLEAALEAAAGAASGDIPAWLDEDLSSDSPAESTLSPLARRYRAIYLKHFKPLYIIFDQFEELYTLGNKAEEQAFVHAVRETLRAKQPVKMIISIREEYLGHLYEFERQVPELLRKKLRVEPMNLDKVKAVIQGIGSLPQSNVRLQAGEEAAVAEDVFNKIRGGEKSLTIQLPYLQVFLDKFYLYCTGDESRQADALFTLTALEQMGGLGDVLRNFLEEQVLLTARRLEQPPEVIWQLLSPFVTLEGTKEPLSEAELHRRLPESTPPALPGRVLEAFVNSRILRFSESQQRYEFAHDTLAKQMHARRSDEEIALLEVQRLIRSQAAIKPEAREFFTGKQLDFISSYLPKLRLLEEEQAWILKSEQQRAALEEAEEQRQREELEKAQRQAAIEKNLADKANAALAELRSKNTSIFGSFAELGTDLIYTLDYEEALEKMTVAVEIDVDGELKKQQLTEPIAELLFFFAESGRRPALARNAAGLLLQVEPEADLAKDLLQCQEEAWETRRQFASLLKKLPFFHKFQARYYPEMVSVPLGDDSIFEMGSPESEWQHQSDEKLHKVQLSPYQLSSTTITFYQFALFSEAVDRGLASRTPYWGRFGDHPVVSVSWYEAVEYANWLNAQQGLPPCYRIQKEKNSDPGNQVRLDYLKWKIDWDNTAKGFRLLTEAEWELAARGGVGGSRTLFAGSDTLDEVGWFWENSGDKPLSGDWDLNKIYDNNGRTHAVRQKRDNGIGIYDMSGNVYEWCWDWYDDNYYSECHEKGVALNPAGPNSSADGRVIRGGSWHHTAEYCRPAFRYRNYPDYRADNVGFRLAFVP